MRYTTVIYLVSLCLLAGGLQATSLANTPGKEIRYELVKATVKVGSGYKSDSQAYAAGITALKVKGAALLATNVVKEYVSTPHKFKDVVRINSTSVVKLSNISTTQKNGVLHISANVELDDAQLIAKMKEEILLSQSKQKLKEYRYLKDLIEQGQNANKWNGLADKIASTTRYKIDMDYLKTKSKINKISKKAKLDALKKKVDDVNARVLATVKQNPLLFVSEVHICENDVGRKIQYINNSVSKFLIKWWDFYSDRPNPPTNKNAFDLNYPLNINAYKCIDVVVTLNTKSMSIVEKAFQQFQIEKKKYYKELRLAPDEEVPNVLLPERAITINSQLVFGLLADGRNLTDLDRAYVKYLSKDEERSPVKGYFSFLRFSYINNKLTYTWKNTADNDKCLDNGVYFKKDYPSCYAGERLLPLYSYIRADKHSQVTYTARVFYGAGSLDIESIDTIYKN
ncbi:hypothetical protein ACMAZF_20260 (plasmid) [Psychrobium sp. nBUS_13]|uniref:hypothetical protein n=1 Tax=Psychrobium sp. nBUS_13 TaxID=3395319 RepID=UPI003EBFA7C2